MSFTAGRKKRIVILGSTGSVGKNGCKVAEALRDKVEVVGLAANSNFEVLAEQAATLGASFASISDNRYFEDLQKSLPAHTKPLCGMEGILEMVTSPDVDMVLCAIVGTSGLLPVMEAIKHGKTIALASKEVMVMAGEKINSLLKEYGGTILPVDSEHSALFQCIGSAPDNDIARLILTASGGPFRKTPAKDFPSITWEKAIAHPVWSMGSKVSLDSATLMNKALEVVEAHYLFHCPVEKIDVIIHPQAKIHSMVEFADGALLAHLGVPDMRFPIQYAFSYPERWKGQLPRLSLTELSCMEFEKVDENRFPSLAFAREALRKGGTAPCIMNAANEVAYEFFREGRILFPRIWDIIEKTMANCESVKDPSLEEILASDRNARIFAGSLAASK